MCVWGGGGGEIEVFLPPYVGYALFFLIDRPLWLRDWT